MTNDELVEKVARGIAEAAIIDSMTLSGILPCNSEWIAEQVGEDWPVYKLPAKAAIQALGLDGANMLIPNWRDISEAPRDREWLMLRAPDHEPWMDYWEPAAPHACWMFCDQWTEPVQPTHFIPLSSIPTPNQKD